MTTIGPYELIEKIGEGGMGVVWRARHTELDREVALKLIGAGEASDELRRRFRREAQAAAKLAGTPGIVGVHDFGEADGSLYLAMDLLPGGSLADRIAGDGLPPMEAARIGAALARALELAHDSGTLHRDLKPDNVLFDDAGVGGNPAIADFGLATSWTADPAVSRLTQSGTVLGTPAYMPPEQALSGTGQLALSPASDIYSLGATLYECLTGAPPFEGDSIHGVLMQTLRDRPRPLVSRVPNCPRDLETVVLRCLEKSPGDRYPTAAALASELERVLAGEPIQARSPGLRRRFVQWGQRHPFVAGALSIGVTVVAAALALAVVTSGGDRQLTTAKHATDLESRVAAAAAPFRALSSQSRAPMRVLTDFFHACNSDPEAVEQAVAAIDAMADEQQRAHPESRTPAAWRALVQVLAGKEITAVPMLEHACAEAGDDPFPHLVHAWARLALYSRDVRLPDYEMIEGKLVWVESPDHSTTPLLVAAVRDALAAARHAALWPRVRIDRSWTAFALAADAVASGAHATAALRFKDLGDDALFGDEAALLSGIASMHALDVAAASEVLTRAAARGWFVARRNAATAAVAQGVLGAAPPPGHDDWNAVATAHMEAAVAAAPGFAPALHGRAWVLTQRAKIAQVARDLDTANRFAARAEADIRLALSGNAPPHHWTTLGGILQLRATLEEEGERFDEALETLDEARTAFERADQDAPAHYAVRLHLPGVLICQAEILARLGRDTGPALTEARALTESALQAGQMSFFALLHHAQILRLLAKRESDANALPLYEAAAASAKRATELEPDVWWAWIMLAQSTGALARSEQRSPAQATAHLAQQDEALTRLERLHSGDWRIRMERATYHTNAGRLRKRRGLDPSPAWNQAMALLQAILAKHPDVTVLYGSRGQLHKHMAEALPPTTPQYVAAMRLAVADLAHIAARTPSRLTLSTLAEARSLLAQSMTMNREAGMIPVLERSIAGFTTCLERWGPHDVSWIANRGGARYLLAQLLRRNDPARSGKLLEETLADHTWFLTLETRPEPLAMGHVNRGAVLAKLGRRDEAIAAFEKALTLQPGIPQAQARLAKLRGGGGK